MKLLLLNHIQNARDSLRANRLRTILTTTGVTIGVASIVAILSLATGASNIVARQVNELGGTIAVVRPGAETTTTLNDLANRSAHNTFSTSSLSLNDATKLKQIDNVEAAAPLVLLTGTLRGDSTAPTNSSIVATTPDFFTISGITTQAGSFDETSSPIATLGNQLSINLFGTENSLGKTFTLRGETFRVGGVLSAKQTEVNFNGIDYNTTAFIPVDSAKTLSSNLQVQQINIQVASVENLDRVIIDSTKLLSATHGDEQDFSILTGTDISEPTTQLFFAIAGVTAAVAGISLLVGGIGIMNIMLVNVAERTREIGIRRALGATKGDIIWQFLVESLIMSIIGGILGVLTGFGLAFIISLFLTFDPAINWQTLVVAFVTSVVVGLLFGLYPAFRAARKDPIESLRQSN